MKASYKTVLLLLGLTGNLAALLVAPALNLVANDFPDTSQFLIQLIITLTSFFVIPSLLSMNFVSSKLSKKSILLFGLILYVIGGVGPAFMHSVMGILVFRAILGLGVGFVFTTTNTLIAENFQGNARIKMNGLVTAIGGLGGAAFLLISGSLSAMGWRVVFLAYSYSIILFILVLLFVPKDKPERHIAVNKKQEKPSRLPAKVYWVSLGAFGILTLYSMVPTNIAAYMADNGFGNATATGYVTAISLLGLFIGGTSAKWMVKILKRAAIPLAVLLYALAFLILSSTHTLGLVMLSVCLFGIGFGFAYPVFLESISNAAPKKLTSAISLLSIFTYLGQFVPPIVLIVIHLAGVSTLRGTFLTLGVITGAAFVLVSIFAARKPANITRFGQE
ncbi:MFS transporter [Paenibacillus sp. 2TAB23]|uniref:MFS transporter n=1 Tax=Paenibacillus sp. 2TAB23 TaxID=3233004 RepID=UPI003F9ACB15